MKLKTKQIKDINAVLAQTQCQLCDYEDCQAYAKAIIENQENIDRCLPGGEKTVRVLAALTHQNPAPFLQSIQQNTKAITLAIIREDECIGCTKCIQACPVDAIIGSGKQMHTVMTDFCNGCERCIPPCPVDCIDTIAHPKYQDTHEIAEQSEKRYATHLARQQKQHEQEIKAFKKDSLDQRKATIAAAIKRAEKIEKIEKSGKTT